MRLGESKQELAALPKLQYKNVVSYGYQLLLQFCALELGCMCMLIGMFHLGTCENPEEAMKETQGRWQYVRSC
jgi:hypothetical protein